MARTKRTYRANTHNDGSPGTGAPNVVPRPLNLRARNRKIECRWVPDVESELDKTTPLTRAELDAICQLLGEDLERLLQN